jgi:transposase-like protein
VVEAKVPPSVEMFKEFEGLLKEGKLDLGAVVKRGAQYLLQCAVELEVKDLLGRDYYQHASPEQREQGRRSGYEGRRVLTGEGAVEVKLPQVRNGKKPFHSKIVEAYVARTASLEDLVNRMYVHGLSTRDVEVVLQELLEGRGISRSVVSQLTVRLAEDFEKFRRRSLREEWFWYLFLDGTYVKYRVESEKKEPVLAAYGIREDGRKVLLGLAPGSRESTAAWKSFLNDMRSRGLRAPLVVTSDGNPGVRAAIEEVWPHSLRQRCQKHRLENVLDRVPTEHHEDFKKSIFAAFHHEGSHEEGLALAKKVVEKYEKKFPEAMRILSEDLEACLVVLKLPLKHRRIVRTTNLLERLFGENRRRTKVIPHFFQEGAAMKLIYATLVAASRKWRGVEITTVMYRELSELRDEVLPKQEWQMKAIA